MTTTEALEFQEMFFCCSKLGCLLLHCNSTDDVHHFNPFLMMPINMRVHLNLSKLVPVDTEDALDQNALWKMVNCYDPMHSPLSGTFSGVLASFQVGGSSVNTNLSPVYGSLDGLNLVAIPVDRVTMGNALKWLGGDEVMIDDSSSVQDLCIKFLRLLNEMDIPNGSVDHLTDFIRRRTWDETRLWGGTMAEFWELVTSTEDEKEKWRILRVFIDSNMSWQTRVAFFAIDALHRAAVGNMAFNGLYIPGSDLKLREAVNTYVKKLVPVDESHPYLSIQTDGGTLHSIECSVKLCYCVPNMMGDDFLIRMQHTSTSLQGSQGKLTGHTIIHLLGSFLGHFHRTVTSKVLKYLYYPGDSSKGIEATLRGIPMDHNGSFKNAFRDILINDSLCDSDSWEDMAKRIEAYKKKFDWKDEAVFSGVYIAIWLDNFTKVAYETLKDLIQKFPEFTKIDHSLKLGLILDMSLSQFQRMFQHSASGGYPKEGSLESFRLDAHQLPIKEPMVLSVFYKRREKHDIYHGDPYKKPTGGMMLSGDKVGNFPPFLLEFVWLLMYAHFSEDSFNSILKLSQPPSNPQVMTTNDQAKDLARRYLRCVIFTISASQFYSAKYWQHGYFPRDKSTGGLLVNKMNKPTQLFFLTMSAIRHTCSFFQMIGINPKLPELTEPIHDWVLEKELKQYEKIVQDPVVMYTFFFCYQAHMQDNPGRQPTSWTKEDSCRVLDIAIRSSTGRTDITTFRSDHRAIQDEWIGNFTLGGLNTLSMSPDPVILKEMYDQKGYLLEVLGDDRYSQPEPRQPTSLELRPITHRISEFARWSIDYPSFFEFLLSSLDQITLSKALVPSPPQGVESEVSSQKLSSSGNEPTVAASSTPPVQGSAHSQSVENERASQKQSSGGNELTAPPASTSPSQVATDSQGVEDAGTSTAQAPPAPPDLENDGSSQKLSSIGDYATGGPTSETPPAIVPSPPQGVEREVSSQKMSSSGNEPTVAPSSMPPIQASALSQSVENERASQKQSSGGNELTAPPASTSPSQVATDSQGVEDAGEGDSSVKQPSSGNDATAGSASGTSPVHIATDSQGLETDVPEELSKDAQAEPDSQGVKVAGEVAQQDIQSDSQKRKQSSTTKAKTDGAPAVKKHRQLGFKYFSKTIGTILPKVIDLTNSGDEDDAMEEKIAGLDEDAKNMCLRVFFKYLKSNRTKLVPKVPPKKEEKKTEKENSKPIDEAPPDENNVSTDEAREDSSESKKAPKKQKRFGCPLIEYEAGCSDKQASSDEHTDDTGDISRNMEDFITGELLEEEGYLADHRLVGRNVSEATETNARSLGKQLYQFRGKRFNPPFPATATGVKSLRQPRSESDSDSSNENEFEDGDNSDSQHNSGQGKTSEDEEEDQEVDKEEVEEENKEGDDDDTLSKKPTIANDFDPSSDRESSESTGNANDVFDSGDNIGTDSHREDFIHDQNVNFDRGNRGGEDDPLESSNNVDDISCGISNMPDYMQTFLRDSFVPDYSLNSNIGDSSVQDLSLDSNVDDSSVPRRTSARKKPPKRKLGH